MTLAPWQQYSDRLAITLAAGGEVPINPNGLYERTCRQHDLPTHPLLGSWRVLPLLYGEDVLCEADVIMNKATKLAAGDDEATARVGFFKDGLRFLRATRGLMAIVNQQPQPESDAFGEIKQHIAQLRKLSLELSPKHVIWGDVVLGAISRRIFKINAADIRGK